MVQTAADLQQLKGVGRILGKRLYDAGFDSFAKIAHAGEQGLQKVRGISPRYLKTIVEQATQLVQAAHPDRPDRAEALQQRLSEVKVQLQTLAETTRQRFQQQLVGKPGKKLTLDLVRIEDALEMMTDGGKKGARRAGKALAKAEKRVAGLEEASLKKVRKGLKRARKAVLKAL
jgi:glutamate/tyrosine decarboxylase-like PLP-dependent enzyme